SSTAAARLGDTVNLYLLVAVATTLLLNALAIFGIRRWNPTREASPGPVAEPKPAGDSLEERLGQPKSARAKPTASPRGCLDATRAVWDYPIIWREMRTWAYGRKVVFVRGAYVLLAAAAIAALYLMASTDEGITRYGGTLATVPLFVLS